MALLTMTLLTTLALLAMAVLTMYCGAPQYIVSMAPYLLPHYMYCRRPSSSLLRSHLGVPKDETEEVTFARVRRMKDNA